MTKPIPEQAGWAERFDKEFKILHEHLLVIPMGESTWYDIKYFISKELKRARQEGIEEGKKQLKSKLKGVK